VSLTDGDERDSKFLCSKWVRMCRGVCEALCILLLVAEIGENGVVVFLGTLYPVIHCSKIDRIAS